MGGAVWEDLGKWVLEICLNFLRGGGREVGNDGKYDIERWRVGTELEESLAALTRMHLFLCLCLNLWVGSVTQIGLDTQILILVLSFWVFWRIS